LRLVRQRQSIDEKESTTMTDALIALAMLSLSGLCPPLPR